jgi:uncharacterized phage protein (TIGR01671 family)
MREILFRGKRKDNGKWVKGQLLKSDTGVYYIVTSFDDMLGIIEKYEVDEITVGQFSGLTDKNGKEIFKGDIHEHMNMRFTVDNGAFYDADALENYVGWHLINYKGACSGIDDNASMYINIVGNMYDKEEK